MNDGHYRVIPKEGTSYEILDVEDDMIVGTGGGTVDDFLGDKYTFTRVYPIHLPDEMMEWVHDQALSVAITDDAVIEEAIRRFMLVVKGEEK